MTIGIYEFMSLTPDTLEGGIEVIRKSFFVYEKLSIGVEVSQHPEAATELEELCLRTAKDGVSMVAIEKATSKVVGVSFNKLQVKTKNRGTFLEQFASTCKSSSARALVQFTNDAEAVVDLFDLTKSDCLLELLFLATFPQYWGKGIAKKLIEFSIELGKALVAGKNVKVPLDDKPLMLGPVPTAVSATFTSSISQHLGKKLGFARAAEVSYEEAFFGGKSFASRIGPVPPSATVDYKLL